MCSCIAKVTAPPPHTEVSWLLLTLPNCVQLEFLLSGPRQFRGLADTATTALWEMEDCKWYTRTPVALSCCIHLLLTTSGSWQWQFNCHEPLCQSPARTQLPCTDWDKHLSQSHVNALPPVLLFNSYHTAQAGDKDFLFCCWVFPSVVKAIVKCRTCRNGLGRGHWCIFIKPLPIILQLWQLIFWHTIVLWSRFMCTRLKTLYGSRQRHILAVHLRAQAVPHIYNINTTTSSLFGPAESQNISLHCTLQSETTHT